MDRDRAPVAHGPRPRLALPGPPDSPPDHVPPWGAAVPGLGRDRLGRRWEVLADPLAPRVPSQVVLTRARSIVAPSPNDASAAGQQTACDNTLSTTDESQLENSTIFTFLDPDNAATAHDFKYPSAAEFTAYRDAVLQWLALE